MVVNGWTLFAHPLFLQQLETLTKDVEKLRRKDPAGYASRNATKRLIAIRKLVFEIIPQEPGRPEYRQGITLGDQYKHWHRAKFFQQYRLFFRYHTQSQIIAYARVNDESTKRAYGSGDDAYLVFGKMLKSGNPPDDWQELLKQVTRLRADM